MNKTNLLKKPFPLRCAVCKEKAVYGAVVKHTTEIQHDGRLYEVTVDRLHTPKCRACGRVIPDGEANRTITRAFLRQAKLLTPEQIRGFREKLGLTQQQLATELGIAEASVSRWETGAQIQQRSLDNLLRLYFGVPLVRRELADPRFCKRGLVASEAV